MATSAPMAQHLATGAAAVAAAAAQETEPEPVRLLPSPSELGIDNVVLLRRRDDDDSGDGTRTVVHVYLIGTVHVSPQSCDDVRKLIAAVRPSQVLVELDATRSSLLVVKPSAADMAAPGMSHLLQAVRGQGLSGLFAALLALAASRMAGRLKQPLGAEFRAAYEAARAVGARTVLGDRPLPITLRRAWGAMSAWQRLRLLADVCLAVVWPDVELPDTDDGLEAVLDALAGRHPVLWRVLVRERDQYMAAQLARCRGPVVVGVVGKGHLTGMQREWQQPVDLNELVSVPRAGPGRRTRVLLLLFLLFAFYMVISKMLALLR